MPHTARSAGMFQSSLAFNAQTSQEYSLRPDTGQGGEIRYGGLRANLGSSTGQLQYLERCVGALCPPVLSMDLLLFFTFVCLCSRDHLRPDFVPPLFVLIDRDCVPSQCQFDSEQPRSAGGHESLSYCQSVPSGCHGTLCCWSYDIPDL